MDIEWFKKNIGIENPKTKFEYSFFKNGDFGNLNRVEFEEQNKIGNVDFWDSGWLEIHIYDYKNEKQLFHVLLEPEQIREKENSFKILNSFLG